MSLFFVAAVFALAWSLYNIALARSMLRDIRTENRRNEELIRTLNRLHRDGPS